MNSVFKDILKSKYFLWPVSCFSSVAVVVAIYFLSIREVIVFPNTHQYIYNYYTDKSNGGNSQVSNFKVDSAIRVDFDLKEGFVSPYIGVSISPVKTKHIDIKGNNQLSIKLKGKEIDRLGISIFTPPVELSKNYKNDEGLFHSFINITDKTAVYAIPLSRFEAPEWWKDLHDLPADQSIKADIKKIVHLNIGTAYTSDIKKKMQVEISHIAFTRDNKKVFVTLAVLELFVLLVSFAACYLKIIFKNRKEPVTVFYKPLDVSSKEPSYESYIEFINSNFHKSELDLEMVSKATSISPKRITHSINTRFDCNFRTYINRIRVNESKRLLTQTNLNIGEIAFKVGFNNQSSYNRVFKSEMNISPSEYRDKFRK